MDVKNRQSIVTVANSFCDTAKKVSNIKVVEVKPNFKIEEIEERNANLQLNKELFNDALPVRGSKSFHRIKIIDSILHGFVVTYDQRC